MLPTHGLEPGVRVLDQPNTKLVLVVDDDPDILRLIERTLSGLPLRIEARDQAFGLLNTIAELRPDLVVLDVMMPGLDGPGVTQLLRSDPELAATPVLLFSAVDERQLAKRARECGANGYLAKTEGLRALANEVCRHLSLA